jgi:hypothetical protein
MSALPPKADMCSALAHVRFVPIADTTAAGLAATHALPRWLLRRVEPKELLARAVRTASPNPIHYAMPEGTFANLSYVKLHIFRAVIL